jgi:hypothetical protein
VALRLSGFVQIIFGVKENKGLLLGGFVVRHKFQLITKKSFDELRGGLWELW